MSHVHAIVWLDHRDATVIGYSHGEEHSLEIHSRTPERHICNPSARSPKRSQE